MSDERMQPLLEAWFKDREVTPHDVPDSTGQVMARLPEVRQRGRWWPLLALDRPMSTFPNPALAPAPIPATNGRRRPRGFTMFSAVKFMVASIIVALFGGLLLNGILAMQQDGETAPAAVSASLAPTGVEILTPSTGATTGLVADGDGILWALEWPGRLVRFDPGTDTTTTWTLADDIAFGQAHSMAPSAQGGVWLAGPDAARLFDSQRFAQVIAAPAPLKLAVEADDGTLWAATESGVVLHWDGSSWQDVGPASPGTCDWIGALEVDSAGRLWVGGMRYSSCKGSGGAEVMVLDGSEWTRFDESDASPLGQWPQSIMEMPDGSVWVASEAGLARFDGSAWTMESGSSPFGSLTVSPDGTIWAGADNSRARVRHADAPSWERVPGPDGLPRPRGYARIAIVGDRIFMGTNAGTYERVGDSWEPAWDVAPTRPFGQIGLLATGDDELWVVDAQGVRHVKDGTWTDELDWTTQAPGSDFIWSDLALGPDDTVWVAGSRGVAYHDGEGWAFIDGRPAGAVTVDATGTVWAARTRKSGRCLLWTIQEVDGAWVREDIDGCPLQHTALQSSAIDGDGTLWLGGEGGFGPGGLVRYANGEWEAIEEIGDSEVYGSIVLGTDSEGAVWVLSQANPGSKNVERVAYGPLARFNGDDVSIVELPKSAWVRGLGWERGSLGPDGMPWTSSERGPARFDGQTWRFPYEDAAMPWMQVGAVASDGSVYAVTTGPGSEMDIVRFPASSA